jgi:hypothetical protein
MVLVPDDKWDEETKGNRTNAHSASNISRPVLEKPFEFEKHIFVEPPRIGSEIQHRSPNFSTTIHEILQVSPLTTEQLTRLPQGSS